LLSHEPCNSARDGKPVGYRQKLARFLNFRRGLGHLCGDCWL